MQPIRHIYEEAPDTIPIPEVLRRRRVECILRPLDEGKPHRSVQRKPHFCVADVDVIDIPSREERNARR